MQTVSEAGTCRELKIKQKQSSVLGRLMQSRSKIRGLLLLGLLATFSDKGGSGKGKCLIILFNHSCITIVISASDRKQGGGAYALEEGPHAFCSRELFFLQAVLRFCRQGNAPRY